MRKIQITILFLILAITTNAQVLGDFRSQQTGNWDNKNTWERFDGAAWQNAGAGQIPTITATDTEIQAGHTVTIRNSTDHCNNILLNGTLTYRDRSRIFTVNGNMQINVGGTFEVAKTITTNRDQVIDLYGNLIVNGTLDGFFFDGTFEARLDINFIGTLDATLTGTGVVCEFYDLEVNKSSGMVTVVDIQRAITIDQADANDNRRLRANSGTLTFSGSDVINITPYRNDQTACGVNGKFLFSNPNLTINTLAGTASGNLTFNGDIEIQDIALLNILGSLKINQTSTGANTIAGGTVSVGIDFDMENDLLISGGDITVARSFYMDGNGLDETGDLTVTGGILTIGDGNDIFQATGDTGDTGEGGSLTMSAGVINVFGRVEFSNGTGTEITAFTMTGGNINVDPQHTTNLANGLEIVTFRENNVVNFTGGTLTIIDPMADKNSIGRDAIDIRGQTGLKNFIGSTMIFGDGISASPGDDLFPGYSIYIGGADLQLGDIILNNPAGVQREFVCRTNTHILCNNLTITSANDKYIMTGRRLEVDGNFINNGELDGTTDTYTANHLMFTGTTAQLYSGTGSLTSNLAELTFNNTSATGVSLSADIGAEIVNLTDGHVYTNTSGSGLLTVLGTATSDLTGGTATNYVQGPLRRAIPSSAAAAQYDFPVGKTDYRKWETLGLTSGGSGSGFITLNYFDAVNMDGKTAGNGLANPTIAEALYWQMTTDLASVTLSAIAAIRVTHPNPVATPPKVLGQSNNNINGSYSGIGKTVVGGTILSDNFDVTGLTATGDAFVILSEVEPLTGTYTVGATGDYLNLTTIAAELRVKYVDDNVIFEMLADYDDNTETIPVNFDVVNLTLPTWSVTIRPQLGVAGTQTIQPGTSGAMIIFDDIAELTFDGRPGGVGTSDWEFSNIDATPGPVFGFQNDANNVTLDYLTIKSDVQSTTSAVITFGTTAWLNGNDDNTISNNTITGKTTTPTNIIYSAGSASAKNGGNYIFNNDIFDFFNTDENANGIILSSNSTNWTISGNLFYQTAPRVFTAVKNYSAITILDGTNHTINNNTIGFANSTGTGFTDISGSSCTFRAINIEANNGTSSTVTNNLISGIKFTTNSTVTQDGFFNAVYIGSGDVNVGTAGNGNTIGTSGAFVTYPIQITANGGGGYVSIICSEASRPTNISANTIGGIEIKNNQQYWFSGIYVNNASGDYTISSNTIGSTNQAESLKIGTSGDGNWHRVYGIFVRRAGDINISGNTVANIVNYSESSNSNNRFNGIHSEDGINTISGNQIYKLTTHSRREYGTTSAGLVGIMKTSTDAGQTISNNEVYELINLSSFAADRNIVIEGILSRASSSTPDIISENYVHNLNALSEDAIFYGIRIYEGMNTLQNNMVQLGIDETGVSITNSVTIYGISHEATEISNFYHNSVYIGGTGVNTASTDTSYCFYKSGVKASDIQNNIFYNARSSSAASSNAHYAIMLSQEEIVNQDYNIYYANGTDGLLARFEGVDLSTIYGMKSYPTNGNDLHSGEGDPIFNNPMGSSSTADLHVSGTTPTEGMGILIASVTTDIDNETRSALSPVDIGADAGNYIFAATVDIFAPNFDYVVIEPQACGITSTIIDVTITDQGTGVPLVGGNIPRIYYRDQGTQAWLAPASTSQGVLQSGDGNNGVWRFTLTGLLNSKYYEYYFAAQDQAVAPLTPNIGFSKFDDNSPIHTDVNTMTTGPDADVAIDVFSVCLFPKAVYHVGNDAGCIAKKGSVCDFETLTAAADMFYNLNSVTIDKNVQVLIVADTQEPGVFGLNNLTEDGSGPYTISFEPYDASPVQLLADNTVNNKEIRFEGADRITINGEFAADGNKWLTFEHEKEEQQVFYFIDDAQSNTVKNINIKGSSNLNPQGLIYFAGSSVAAATGNDDNIFDNNKISKSTGNPLNIVYSEGTIGAENSGIQFTNNEILDFQNHGIWATAIANTTWTISDNTMYTSVVSDTLEAVIRIESGEGYTVSNNFIGGSDINLGGVAMENNGSPAFSAISLTVGTGVVSNITNNTIKNISCTDNGWSGQMAGIYANGLINITGNIISGITNTKNTALYGIDFEDGPGGISISDNNINTMVSSGRGYFYGIRYQPIDAVASTIQNNSVTGVTFDSVDKWAYFFGMRIQGNALTNNNQIGGHTAAEKLTLSGNGNGYGISIESSDFDSDYTNNKVYNVEFDGNARFAAHYLDNFAEVAISLQGNEADNITLTNTGADARVYGFFLDDAILSFGTITPNLVGSATYGISNAGTGVTTGIYLNSNNDNSQIQNNTVTNINGAGLISGIDIATRNDPATILNNTITGCTATYPTNFTGIKVRSSNKVLDGNIINDIAITGGGVSSFNGISVEAGTNNTVGTNSANLIGAVGKEITNAGTGLTNGINISGGSGAIVQNNLISYLTEAKANINGILNSTSSLTALDNTINNCAVADLINFTGIKSTAGTSVSIQNNTLHNISLPVGTGGDLYGIEITGGAAQVGTVTGNKLGTVGNPLRNNGDGEMIGIILSSNTAGNIISQNEFAEISGLNGAACISSSSTNNVQITNHDVTGWDISDDKKFFCIFLSNGNSSSLISGNSFHDFNMTSTGTAASFSGIETAGGSTEITANTIHTISSASINSSTGAVSAIQGIVSKGATSNDIHANEIYNLLSTGTGATSVMGIYEESEDVKIRKNKIYKIQNTSTSAGAIASGIVLSKLNTGYVSNNMISIGADSENPTYTGIRIDGADVNAKNVYFNSVYIGGNSTGTNNSYAFLRTGTAALNLRNNIFSNFRTGTGKQYAIANPDGGNWTSNTYSKANAYYSATAATTGLWGATDVTFDTWLTNSGESNEYLSTDSQPFFIDAANCDLHLTNLSNSCGFNSVGEPFASVLDDYDGDVRSANPDIGADEFTPTGRSGKYVWRGYAGTDWDTNLSWQCEIVPIDNPVELIVIPETANDPIIGRTLPAATVLADPIQIRTNGILTINPGNSLTLAGNFELNGSIVIETPANASGASGSFIDNGTITGTGSMTAKRFINGGQYHEVSSAVENVNSALFTESNPSGNYNSNLYWYDETVDLDGNAGTAPAGPFDNNNLVPGWQFVQATTGTGVTLEENLGYMFYTDMNQTISMTGTPSTGNYDVTGLTFTGNDANGGDFTVPDLYDGWELLGNPYPSSLDWDAMKATRTNIDDAIYVWDNTGYSGYINGSSVMLGNLTKDIAPMQGFFVHTNASGASVDINNSHRAHNAPQYLRDAAAQKENYLRLKTSANGHEDYIVIQYLPQASAEFDGDLDLLRMFVNPDYGDATLPQLYSLTDAGNPLAYNSLPFGEMGNKTVPLGFRIGNAGTYTIAAVELNDFEGLHVYLHDTQENRIINLRTNPSYTFDYAGGQNDTRFYLNLVGNHAPVAENQIENKETLEDAIFNFAFAEDVFRDVDLGDILRYEVQNLPSWLSFNSSSRSFYGTPKNGNVGIIDLSVIAFDTFNASETMTFSLDVINTNDAPTVEVEIQDTETTVNEMFVYQIAPTAFADIDLGDNLTLSAELDNGTLLPFWLLFDEATNTFSGLPENPEILDIKVIATDNFGASISDVFILTVKDVSGFTPIADVNIDIYPNPATDFITVALPGFHHNENITAKITDITGKVVYESNLTSEKTEINLRKLPAGAYFIEIRNNLDLMRVKFVKE